MTNDDEQAQFALYDRVRAWAVRRWGDRVKNVNFRAVGLYMVSLDGPPCRGENHFIRVNGDVFEESPEKRSVDK